MKAPKQLSIEELQVAAKELLAAIDAEREALTYKPDPWHPKPEDIRISPRTIWAMTARAAYVTMPARKP